MSQLDMDVFWINLSIWPPSSRFPEKNKAAQHRRWTADEAGTKAATTLGDTASNLFGLFWRL